MNIRPGDTSLYHPMEGSWGWGQYWSKAVHIIRAVAIKYPHLWGDSLLQKAFVVMRENCQNMNSWKIYPEKTMRDQKFKAASKKLDDLHKLPRRGDDNKGFWFEEDAIPDGVVEEAFAFVLAQLKLAHKSGSRANFTKLKTYVMGLEQEEREKHRSFHWITHLVMPPTPSEISAEEIKNQKAGEEALLECWN